MQENEGLFLGDNVEIEYNEDFDSSKTKSLTKFPKKNEDFDIDKSSNICSKSLKFNSKICFAPKIKYKQYKKQPSPLFFKKKSKIQDMNTQYDIITEDILSEKESSLMDDSSSYECMDEANINFNNKNDNNINNNIEDSDKKEYSNDNKNKINIEKENPIKLFEHKTIGVFNNICNKDKESKNNIKYFRNYLYKIKIKDAQIKNKEQEYKIKNEINDLYGLNLIFNYKKSNINNEYTIIPIKKEDNYNSDEDSNDMSNLRGTISYNESKLNKEKKKRSTSIYEVLSKSIK